MQSYMYEEIALAIDVHTGVVEDVTRRHDDLVLDRFKIRLRAAADSFADALRKIVCAHDRQSAKGSRLIRVSVVYHQFSVWDFKKQDEHALAMLVCAIPSMRDARVDWP